MDIGILWKVSTFGLMYLLCCLSLDRKDREENESIQQQRIEMGKRNRMKATQVGTIVTQSVQAKDHDTIDKKTRIIFNQEIAETFPAIKQKGDDSMTKITQEVIAKAAVSSANEFNRDSPALAGKSPYTNGSTHTDDEIRSLIDSAVMRGMTKGATVVRRMTPEAVQVDPRMWGIIVEFRQYPKPGPFRACLVKWLNDGSETEHNFYELLCVSAGWHHSFGDLKQKLDKQRFGFVEQSRG
ncbi:MAG: hypothetical protein KGI54_13540 [Pseudomonadota bacterium]|nr:hypothetical protein [Pseudomonadota bacterium]